MHLAFLYLLSKVTLPVFTKEYYSADKYVYYNVDILIK